MFDFLKRKTSFEKYYLKFISHPPINKSKNHKPITAAYLFVLTDFGLMSQGKRKKRLETADQIFSILENKLLSSNEIKIFDKATELFGAIARGAIQVRGDWCFSNDDGDNPVYNLFLCYGDLIRAPRYLDNYESSPILIGDIMNQMNFTIEFNRILGMSLTYLDEALRN